MSLSKFRKNTTGRNLDLKNATSQFKLGQKATSETIALWVENRHHV